MGLVILVESVFPFQSGYHGEMEALDYMLLTCYSLLRALTNLCAMFHPADIHGGRGSTKNHKIY